MDNNNNVFKIFDERKLRLVSLLKKGAEVFETIGLNTIKINLQRLEAKVQASSFKLMVIGEFKRGKSTFINALLHEEVLPAFATPTTAVINEIKWGSEKKAILYFKHPLKNQPLNLPADVKAHIAKAGTNAVPSMKIKPEDLEKYVVIADPTKDQEESVGETPYKHVELFWPLDILHSGVELIDSPGLNEHETRTEITTKYLQEADALLFVISCLAPLSQTEDDFIRQTHQSGYTEIFFICNRIDQIREKERDRLKDYINVKLKPLTQLKNGIHFLSASLALEGRIENRRDKVEQSGILPLEEAMQDFLMEHRAKIKIIQPSKELIHQLASGKDKITEQRALQDVDRAEILQRYESVKPLLDAAIRSKSQIIKKIDNIKDQLENEVRSMTRLVLLNISNQIPSWTNALQLDNKIAIISFDHKGAAEAVANEIGRKIKGHIEHEIDVWQKSTLEPRIEEIMQNMREEVTISLDRFYDQMKNFDSSFSGLHLSANEQLGKNPSNAERFFSTLGGLVLGDIFSAAHGAKFGMKGLGVAIATQLGITIALILAGIANPLVWIGALFAGGLANAAFRVGKINDQVKIQVGEKIKEEFLKETGTQTDSIVMKVSSNFGTLRAGAEQLLDDEVQTREEQVQTVLKRNQDDERAVQKRLQEFSAMEKKIVEIERELQELVLEVGSNVPADKLKSS